MSARYRTLLTAIALSFAACADESLPPVEGRGDGVEVEDASVGEDDDKEQQIDAGVTVVPDSAVTTLDGAVAVLDAAVGQTDATVGVDAAADAAVVVPVESHLPCEVEAILVTNCQKCHGATAKNGVPLLTRDNLLAPSPKDPTANVITRVLIRAAALDKPMPPVGKGEPLSESDRAVLENWVKQLSPEGDCE